MVSKYVYRRYGKQGMNGLLNNQLIYFEQVVVQENNIYYRSSYSNPDSSYQQLTFSGEEQLIYNGVPNWLYGGRCKCLFVKVNVFQATTLKQYVKGCLV